MYFTDQASIYPNLTKPGPHLLNHSCKPNCWVYIYHGHTLFFALRKIKRDEELTISYLLSLKMRRVILAIITRKCESKFCTGTMHLSKINIKDGKSFKMKRRKKTKITKFVFGKKIYKNSLIQELFKIILSIQSMQ